MDSEPPPPADPSSEDAPLGGTPLGTHEPHARLEPKDDAPRHRPAYHVAARTLVQGACAGALSGAVTTFLFTLAAIFIGESTPALTELLLTGLLFSLALAGWAALLTGVEEFAARGERPVWRILAVSLGFPLPAVLLVFYLIGMLSGGPSAAQDSVLRGLKELQGEFSREPAASTAMTLALLVPFCGLAILRHLDTAREGGYYLGAAVLAFVGALCVLAANVFWGPGLDLTESSAVAVITIGCVVSIAFGLVLGRRLADRWVARYEAWADAS